MKKSIMTILMLVIMLSQSFSQENQNTSNTSKRESIATFKVSEQSSMLISQENDKLTLSIAGYEIGLGTEKSQLSKNSSGANTSKGSKIKCKFTLLSNWKLGFTTLTATDYSNYGDDDKNFMDLKVGKSNLFGFDILGLRVDTRDIGIRTGVSFLTYNLTFADNITLISDNGVISPLDLGDSYKKSKLSLSYLVIPLALSYKLANEFDIEPSVYAGVNLNSHTKYKRPITKNNYISGINQYVTGASLRVKYRSFGVFCDYNLSTLFNNESGPKTNALSIGVSIF